MELSNSMRGRFISDHNLPIQLFKDQYFDYFVNLYDDQFEITSKLESLKQCIQSCGDEEKFFSECHKIRDNVINTIKEMSSYNDFITMDMNPYNVKSKFTKTDIYKPLNNGKSFLSIDLRKANYQIFSKLILKEDISYKEFLSKFIDNSLLLEYFSQSKYLRQVIFGNLNPNRTVTVQKFYTNKILDYLLTNNFVEESDVKVLTYDEIVLDVNGCMVYTIPYYQGIKNALDLEVSVEWFDLKYYENPMPYYVKKFNTSDKVEFKTVPIVYFAQVYKDYFNIPTTEYDYRFLYENKVAQFIKD